MTICPGILARFGLEYRWAVLPFRAVLRLCSGWAVHLWAVHFHQGEPPGFIITIIIIIVGVLKGMRGRKPLVIFPEYIFTGAVLRLDSAKGGNWRSEKFTRSMLPPSGSRVCSKNIDSSPGFRKMSAGVDPPRWSFHGSRSSRILFHSYLSNHCSC